MLRRLLPVLLVCLFCLLQNRPYAVFGQETMAMPLGLARVQEASFGLRGGGLWSGTELDDRIRYQGTIFGRYALRPDLRAEFGLGYGRFTTTDDFNGKVSNFSTDLARLEARILYEVDRIELLEGWRPYIFMEVGALPYRLFSFGRRGIVDRRTGSFGVERPATPETSQDSP
jgi:hypothetical protein